MTRENVALLICSFFIKNQMLTMVQDIGYRRILYDHGSKQLKKILPAKHNMHIDKTYSLTSKWQYI